MMAPVGASTELLSVVDNYVKSNHVMIFSKSTCPFCRKVKQLFDSLGVKYCCLELNQLDNGSEMQAAMAAKAGKSSVPQVFINGTHVGGCDDTMAAHKNGKLEQLLKSSATQDFSAVVDDYIKSNKLLIFSKTTCPYCRKVKELFQSLSCEFLAVELDQIERGGDIHSALKSKLGRTSVPQVFIGGKHVGGCDDTMAAHENGKLQEMLAIPEEKYDFDLVVVGGGSGGLAASKPGKM